MSLLLIALTLSPSDTRAITLTSDTTNPLKPWTITFSQPVANKSAVSSNVYIETTSGAKHPSTLSISDDSERITVQPDKRYEIGTEYRMVVSKRIESKKDKMLKEDSVMIFTYSGTYITAITAPLNPLVTNVKVMTSKLVSTATISLNEGAEQDMLHPAMHTFSKGMRGLALGDRLTIRVYDRNSSLLEEQFYEIRK